jgi:arsenate reductase
MAEGFLRAYQGEEFEAASAGTDPKPEVHPLAVQVMAEVGIDISMQRPQPLNDYLGRAPVRHLLIVCDKASRTCPRIWPGAYTRDHMAFDDPAEFEGDERERLAVFRRVRDEIGRAMKAWKPSTEPVRQS